MTLSDKDRRFGELAVERGFITQPQHDRALEKFQDENPGLAFANYLVDLGFITPSQLTTIQRFVDAEANSSDTDPDSDNLLGKVLGGCEILGSIGAGGMGATFRAHHRRLDREVAAKVLHPRLTRIGGMAERFQREARAAAKLSHPNIISVFDFDQLGSLYFMIMEYVRGRNLKEIVESGGPFNLSEAIWIIGEVLKGLAAAHELGIVHRDIKPANIMLDEDARRVYIADFGTVRMLGASTSETLSSYGEILGTPQYMAPEQATADEVDGRTDLYCVGMMFFELLEGRPPFTANSVVEVLEKQILEPTPPLSEKNKALEPFVHRLTAKNREDRFSTAAEAGRRLEILYRRICQGQANLQVRRDPSRSSGPEAPQVDEQSIEALASHLRASQNLMLVSFEPEDGAEGGAMMPDADAVAKALAASTAPATATSDSANKTSDIQQSSTPDSDTAENDSGRDTHEVLNSVLNGNLQKALPEILVKDNASQLIPELLLLLWKNNRGADILKLAPSIEAAMPSVPAVPFFIGLSHGAAGDYEKARAAFSLAVGLDTSHVPAHIHLATVLVKLNRSDEAERVMRQVALMNPNSVLASVRLAEFLAGPARDLRGAVEAFEKAISLAADRVDLRLKLGHILCRLDRLDDAEAVVSEIVEWTRDQSSHDVVEGLESLKETIQKCREAKASKTSDRMPAANERLPFEDEKSEAKKKKTRRGPPAKIKARLELMRLAVASQKWEWLQEIYENGKAEYPEVSQFHLAFGQAALRLRFPNEAKSAFEETLRLKPNSIKARQGIERANDMMNNS